MRRTQRPARPDLRAPWQIAQAAACGCKGTDDMCPCQNVEGWPVPPPEPGLAAIAGYARSALFADESGRLAALKTIIRIAEGKAP